MKNILPSFSIERISERLLHIMGLSIGYCSLLLLLVINTANAAPFAYLNAGNSVAVVDVETMTEVQRIDVGRNLGYLHVRPGGNYLYGVSGADGNTNHEITVIDTSSHTLVSHFEVAARAGLMFVTSSPDGKRIYAVDRHNYLYFIDAETHELLHSLEIIPPDPQIGFPKSEVEDIDVSHDSKHIMISVGRTGSRAGYRFYDAQTYASIGQVQPLITTLEGREVFRNIRANPYPRRTAADGLHGHLFQACGRFFLFPGSELEPSCILSSLPYSEETNEYYSESYNYESSRAYAFFPTPGNSFYNSLTFSYDGELAFISERAGGDNFTTLARIHVATANAPGAIGSYVVPINDTQPINLDAHPGRDELFLYTGKADLYRLSYERSDPLTPTGDFIHISGGGIATGHFVGGPMQLTASIQTGTVRFPHLPLTPSSQKVFSFHNRLNQKPVALQCSLDNGQAFTLSGGDVNVSLQPDEAIEFTVSFSTALAGQYTDTLRCSDSNNGEFIYSLEGNYVAPVTATPASGSLVVLPTQWPATGATYQTINFQNPNLTPANVSCSISGSTGELSVTSNLTVPASGNANLRVNLDSANTGTFNGTLSCSSDVGGSFVYDLSGETITPLVAQPIWPLPSRGALEMGYIYPLQSELQRTLSFENENASPLGFSCQLISDDSGFTLEPVPGQVAAGGMVDVTVTYRSNAPALETLARLDCEDETGQQWSHNFRANALMPINATPAKNSDVILPPQRVGTAPTAASFTFRNPENLIEGLFFYCQMSPSTPSFVIKNLDGFHTLPTGEEKSFSVEFNSSTAGNFSTALTCYVLQNDIGEGLVEQIEYTLNASTFYALTSSPRSGSTINLPDVSIDPEATSASAGEELSRATNAAISFQNHAPADESLSCSLNDGSVFSISATPMTIPANSSASLTVTFNPVTPGEYTDTLSCSGASGDLFTFTLKAKGVESPPRRTEMQLPLSEGPHSGKMLNLSVTDSEWSLDAAQSLTAASVGAALPQGVILPHGAVSLRLTEGTAGNSSTIVLSYPFELPAGARYYKYGPTADNPDDHWYAYPGAVISGNTITLTLTDGGAGDSDLSVNGIIDDPGGPAWISAAPGNVTAIPTLPQWAMMLLAGIMGMLALNRMRVRNT
ncbi:IPTL-CTERM sorting domain-containing protein [Marinobacterium iners]|uniref:IPTL-CTERM protein sorting domain-containing protein n=1 Tax=Marinobacterium iners DSM 11526 TaxID=1122198 RepID=A0A1H4C3R2_9GAMM|nr:IPTL-CTERM sorting domain-containing protein [Marinobacterium iners]SEA54712.1 IPTL-CTERM protein sorting domain-containing protein [Marinobacterium iners DSM 11526]